ncbi:MAG: class I SAM-dependent methyltransferase [Gemmatimonadales bacterium]
MHARAVFPRRISRLVAHLRDMLPPRASVLDIGAGNGLLARRLMDEQPGLVVRGVDVLVRSHTEIPVESFDGVHLPAGDRSVDYTMFIDVLHHVDEPAALVAEAVRVSRRGLLIKDHVARGPSDRAVLRLMDWVGNAGHGVRLPYRYLSRGAWDDLLRGAGLREEYWTSRLRLYPFPASLIFDRTLHFVGRFAPTRNDGEATPARNGV